MMKIVLGIVIAGILLIGGCTILLGGAANEVDKAITGNAERPGGTDNPLDIEEGKGFEIDGMVVADGWKIKPGFQGSAEITGLKVTNEREDRDSFITEVKFLKGSEVVGLIDCSTEPITPGQTTTADCSSLGDKVSSKYDKITVNDTF